MNKLTEEHIKGLIKQANIMHCMDYGRGHIAFKGMTSRMQKVK